eukprot:TRINITY_DN11758_c0_g1_i1.p1 TRINITY_DN11758_c0_g1~~TRINITY_DN11758_c0_g1_i1.p1  ORF type:complete len:179 (+),score=47.69 TRINITY_DN11758_c0_g1_i1:78-539(+)
MDIGIDRFHDYDNFEDQVKESIHRTGMSNFSEKHSARAFDYMGISNVSEESRNAYLPDELTTALQRKRSSQSKNAILKLMRRELETQLDDTEENDENRNSDEEERQAGEEEHDSDNESDENFEDDYNAGVKFSDDEDIGSDEEIPDGDNQDYI